ncbi:hypothetical protein LRD69_15400 [Streptomyces sp. JH14]|uniref:hypothetical protein n=1 Tax=Streptomyces sp. JH14 TaxID=2793630 RepID=UPI0023F8B272|nr:hypothetical protein [Streptomyces sp. JH14]MDF6043491.1 hypothetical protein [Streptomyces sp. JH14]
MVTMAVAGCGNNLDDVSGVTKSELSGVWQGENGSSLTLKENMTFTAKRLNTSYTEGSGVKVIAEEVVEGAGEWFSGDYSSATTVDLHFTRGGGATLTAASLNGDTVLWAWVGDGDAAILRKKD